MARRPSQPVWRIAGLALLYWLVGEAVIRNLTVGPTIALVWPSAGIALAALVRFGTGLWPGVFIGALGVGFTTLPLPVSIPVALGNTLGPLIAATLLERLGFQRGFPRQRDLGWFLLIGIGLLPLPGAAIAAFAIPFTNATAPGVAAFNWWLGDSLGVLLLTPWLLADFGTWRDLLKARDRMPELVLVLAVTALTAGLAFLMPSQARMVAVLPVPVVLWAALRLGSIGAGLAMAILAGLVAIGTSLHLGPFVSPEPSDTLLNAWTYLALIALTALTMAALVSERDAAVAAARASEDRYRAIIEESTDLICRYRADGTLTFVNETYCRTFGRPRSELIGRKFLPLVPKEDHGVIEQLASQLDPDMAPLTLEHRVVVSTGELRWQQWTNTPVHDEAGRFVEYQATGRDVTERRQAEDALRSSEARYRAIVDAEPECVKIVDADGMLTEMNSAGLAMIEAESLANVRGRPVVGLIRPADRDPFRALHAKVMAGGTGSLEFGIVGLLGSERLVHSTAAPLHDEHGRVMAMLSVTRDVTEERRGEQQRAEADRLMRRVIEIMPGALYVYDVGLDRTVFLSPSAGRILGIPPERITSAGVSLPDIVHPDDRHRLEEQFAVVRRSANQEIFTCEYRVAHSDGTWRHLLSRDTVLNRGPGGEVLQIVGAVSDVTDRHDAEVRVRRMAAFPELNPAPVLELSADGSVTYANDAALSMAGVAEAAGAVNLLPADYPTIVAGVLATGQNRQQVEMTREGRTLSCSFFPIAAQGVVHCYVTDVTESLEMRHQLERAQRIESIGQLAGGVAHDFNNLLQVIAGFAALARTSGIGDPERTQHLDQVLEATGRAAQLTRQLLAFGRRQPLRITDLDLNQVITGMLPMLRRLIEERVTIDFVPAFEPGNVRGDRGQIEQVVLNLCINARDAMPGGGRITIETENVVVNGAYRESHPWAVAGRYVLVTVTDTGAGMEREVMDHIFEPFFTTKSPDRGTGLGLAVAYGIVQQHQGMINVYSEPDVGTTFKVYLPIVARLAASVSSKLDGGARGGTETVLVVEDEPAVRQLAVRLLTRAGYRTIEAADGREAFEIVSTPGATIHLVLMDVVMPRMGGPEAFRAMQTVRPDLPVVFASGYGGRELPPALAIGTDHVLLDKPYDPDQLLRAIRTTLDQRPPPPRD